MLQTTIKGEVNISGIALHSGKTAYLRLKPLPAGSGIIFKRTDLAEDNIIEATYLNVSKTVMCTEIANKAGANVTTIEHLMAAFFFLDLDNVMVEVSTSELPVLEGASYGYMQAILEVGLANLPVSKKVLRIKKPISCELGETRLTIEPSEDFIINAKINFEHEFIGEQSYTYKHGEFSNSEDISKAKTFGFMKDVEQLYANGLALGASADNATILTEAGVLEGCKLTYKDEFVRHKVLDMCGDLYLAGHPILGKVTAFKPSHFANNQLVRQIYRNPENYTIEFLELHGGVYDIPNKRAAAVLAAKSH